MEDFIDRMDDVCNEFGYTSINHFLKKAGISENDFYKIEEVLPVLKRIIDTEPVISLNWLFAESGDKLITYRGIRLKELRLKLGYNVFDFANLLGVTDFFYEKQERGEIPLKIYQYERLLDLEVNEKDIPYDKSDNLLL